MFEELKRVAGLFLEDDVVDIQPLAGGLINSTYRVQTIHNQYFILQKINAHVFPDAQAIQENIKHVGRFLLQSAYPKDILVSIDLKSGDTFYMDEQNKAWRMLHFVENTECHASLLDTEFAKHAAGALAELHTYLSKMSPDELKVHMPEFTNFTTRLLQFDRAMRSAAKERLGFAAKEIEQLKSHRVIIDCFVDLQEKLPQRIIHGDPKLSNFLFKKGGTQVVALIDWDTLMPGTILYDFGDMARSFCNVKGEESMEENGFNYQIYNVIKTSYTESAMRFLAPLETSSLDLAAAAVMAVQALRFLTDYLNGDVYYQINHPMHNLQRAQNQLQVLEGFLENVALNLPLK